MNVKHHLVLLLEDITVDCVVKYFVGSISCLTINLTGDVDALRIKLSWRMNYLFEFATHVS